MQDPVELMAGGRMRQVKPHVGEGARSARDRPPEDRGPSARTQRNYLAASLGLIVVTAYFSATFFNSDEQYQIIEFVGHKLGKATLADMPWEYHERMRAWLQPGFYYAIARALALFGMRDPFVLAFMLRLASGLLMWTAVKAMVRTSLGWGADRGARLVQLQVTTLLGFLPYLGVRASSENLSGSLATMAFCWALDSLREADAARPASAGRVRTGSARLPVHAALTAGLLFGLAFECRFQTAVVAVGLIAWMLFFRRIDASGVAALAGGGGAALGLGALVDRWGYGRWSFPALHYFEQNVLGRVAADRFGADPFYGYAYLLTSNIFAPVVAMLIACLLLAWLRRPKHPLTWVTLPYALVHCALAHKEERFFFPIVLIASASVTLGLSPSVRASPLPEAIAGLARRADAIAARLWGYRRSLVARLIVADNLIGLSVLAVYPLGWRSNIALYQYVYWHVEPGARIWKIGDWTLPEYPFYRRAYWRAETWRPGEAAVLAQGQPAYLVTPLPYDAVDSASLGATPELVYSELPGWQYPCVRGVVGPALQSLRRTLDPISFVPRAKWLTLYRLEPLEPRAPRPGAAPP